MHDYKNWDMMVMDSFLIVLFMSTVQNFIYSLFKTSNDQEWQIIPIEQTDEIFIQYFPAEKICTNSARGVRTFWHICSLCSILTSRMVRCQWN